MSSILLHLIVYAAVLVFAAVVAYRFMKIQQMPLHLRWELYPLPHEPPERAKYGGSHLEELDHWTKPKETNFIGRIKFMIPEMTFLVALFEHNRKMWYRSFPFHFGLYTLAGLIGLIFAGAVLELLGFYVGPELGIGGVVYYLTMLVALAGLGLTTLGAAGLLHMRLFNDDLKDYTSLGHIFNLLLFLGVLGLAWIVFIRFDTDFAATRSFVQSLIIFDLDAPLGGEGISAVGRLLLGLEILSAVLLIAYIPMTHMSHFFVKWFTWDKVRWDDEPNVVGGEIEEKIMGYVKYPVTWSAPHLAADGKKNWLDIAVEDLPKGDE